MTARITIGDEAPNFDLSSTEGVLLMLRDEVPRTSVLLYFFSDLDGAETRADLQALAGAPDAAGGAGAAVPAAARRS